METWTIATTKYATIQEEKRSVGKCICLMLLPIVEPMERAISLYMQAKLMRLGPHVFPGKALGDSLNKSEWAGEWMKTSFLRDLGLEIDLLNKGTSAFRFE